MEIENQKVLKEIQKAKTLSDKALREAEDFKRQAQQAYENAELARQKAKQEEDERWKAHRKANELEITTERSKMTYKTLFVGNMIFTLILAVFVAYGKRGVLTEMFRWFPSRLGNIKSIFLWFVGLYMGAVKFMGGQWKLGAVWCYIIATLVGIVVVIGLLWLLGWIFSKAFEVIADIHSGSLLDPLFKKLVQVDITLGMLYVCLFFYSGIKKILPLNIFSVWLILSFIGWFVWNALEIKSVIDSFSHKKAWH